MEISERELRQMAGAVDAQHREGMATMAADLAELHAETRRYRVESRRRFLRAAGAVAIGGISLPFARLLPAGAQEEEDEEGGGEGATKVTDADLAAFSESVELSAAEAYAAAAATGLLSGPVAPVAALFGAHHTEHAAAFRAAAGSAATRKPNKKLSETLADELKKAKDEKSLLEVAFDVETAAASTYLFALGALESPTALGLVASVLPVESQHAAVLGAALGKAPNSYVPAFENEEHRLDPANFPVA
ncbi:MAG TPA: ferritin-like domain-containing protein [Acidimicrobiales bacterium]|nr:ferritin-like domain-containing protein [Acidimicrobiales bacterium]